MVHKQGTLTNLELALFNAVASIIMVNMLNHADTREVVGRGGRFGIYSKEIAKRAGYSKLTAYHYKLLNRLVSYGYLDAKWETTRIKNFSVTKTGWDWLGLTRYVTLATDTQPELFANVTTHVEQPYVDLANVPF